MKKMFFLFMVFAASILPNNAQAQREEIQQLLLNVAKLAQFKQILSDLKKGYEIVYKGYTTIKGLSEGNFKIHKTFLDALWQVSPAVRKYKRISDIIEYQILLVKEYKNAYKRIQQDKHFTVQEMEYIANVYNNLFTQSLRNLDDLTIIITANKLRMSDDERLRAIDRTFRDMEDKLMFLREFNNSISILALQRAKEQNEVNTIRSIHDVK